MTGKTKAAGWQVGARRTRWSGLAALGPDDPAVRSRPPGGSYGFARRTPSYSCGVFSAVTGTTVAFDKEHLADEATRIVRKDHWARVLDALESAVSARP